MIKIYFYMQWSHSQIESVCENRYFFIWMAHPYTKNLIFACGCLYHPHSKIKILKKNQNPSQVRSAAATRSTQGVASPPSPSPSLPSGGGMFPCASMVGAAARPPPVVLLLLSSLPVARGRCYPPPLEPTHRRWLASQLSAPLSGGKSSEREREERR